MFRVCAWCGRFLGVTPPFDDPETTHGICGDCAEQLRREQLGGGGRAVIVVRQSRRDLMNRLQAEYAGVEHITVQMDSRARERRRLSVYPGRERRRGERRRTLSSFQLAAWRTLGIFVAQRVS